MKKIIFFLIFFIISICWGFFWWNKMHTIKKIIVIDDGEENIITNISQGTICKVLKDVNIEIKDYDKVSPECDSYIEENLIVTIKRRKKVFLKRWDNNIEIEIFGKEKLKNVLFENDVKYDNNDILSKNLDFLVEDDVNIEIIDVEKKNTIEHEKIKFDTIIKNDENKEIGYKKIVQVGVLGVEEKVYDIVLHNGEEFNRILNHRKVVKKSVNEVVVIGTKKVYKYGKSHKGKASWYANKGCDCAANQWLPIGSKVKVTNKSNGKSVIVEINDRGPFVDDRIIDLDKVAFKKISSLSAGIIDMKMEEIVE